MSDYTREQKHRDFEYFIKINPGFFAEHKHKYIGIRNCEVIDFDDDPVELVRKMEQKGFQIGSYILQECTGHEDAWLANVAGISVKDFDYA